MHFFLLLQTELGFDQLYVMGRSVSGNQSGNYIFFNITDTYGIDMRFTTNQNVTSRGFRIELQFYQPPIYNGLTIDA